MKPGDGSDPFSARLLSAGKKDRPTNDQVSRAVALALASSAAVPTPPAAAPASALKIGLAAIGLSALGVVGYAALSPSQTPPKAPVAVTVAPALPSAVETASASTEDAIPVDDLPSAPPPIVTAAARPPAAPTASEASPSTLRDELARLQAARRALRAGDATGALSELAAYRQSFPNGTLRAEEAALRIDAEVAAGDTASAKADAARFATNFPTSPEASRIRALRDKLEEP